jgi:pyruvate dehydrogenase E1 component alpha subunit
MMDDGQYKALDKELKDHVVASMKYAEQSPWPDPIHLEEDVFAPNEGRGGHANN